MYTGMKSEIARRGSLYANWSGALRLILVCDTNHSLVILPAHTTLGIDNFPVAQFFGGEFKELFAKSSQREAERWIGRLRRPVWYQSL